MLTDDPVFARDDIARGAIRSKIGATYSPQETGNTTEAVAKETDEAEKHWDHEQRKKNQKARDQNAAKTEGISADRGKMFEEVAKGNEKLNSDWDIKQRHKIQEAWEHDVAMMKERAERSNMIN